MGRLLGGGRPLVGIDIGSYSIKLAALTPTRPLPELCALAAIRTPPGAVEEGVVKDVQEVAAALTELMAATGLNAKKVATAVGGPRVVARPLTFPPMPQAKLRQSVVWEAEKYIAFSVEESLVEPEVVAERDTPDGRVQDVMVVAAQKELVESRLEVLEAAQLEAVIVDVEPFALLRAFVYGSTDTARFDKTLALLRLGAAYGDVTIVSRGSFVLTRPLPQAGKALSTAVARALNLNESDAEREKEVFAAAPSADGDVAATSPQARRLTEAVTPLLDELGRELRLSLNFFQTQYAEQTGGGSVDEIILTGGTAMLNNLGDYLGRLVGVPCDVGHYLDCLSIDSSRYSREYLELSAPSMSVAVGLALTDPMVTANYGFSSDPAKFGVVMPRRGQ